MTVAALCTIRADKNVTNSTARVECVLIELYHRGVASIAKLYVERRLFYLLSSRGPESLREARFSLGHRVPMWADKIYLLVLLASITLLMHIEVTCIHAGEVTLTQRDLELADLTVNIFSHIEVAVAALARLGIRCLVH